MAARAAERSAGPSAKARASARTSRSRILPIGAIALVVLVPLAVYVRTEPGREDRALRTASESALRSIVAQRPTDARALYYLGVKLHEAGNDQEASATFQRAANLSDDEEIFVHWAGVVQAGQAINVLRYCLQRHPDSGPCTLALAQVYDRTQEQDRALQESRAAVRLCPQSAAAWQTLGDSAYAMLLAAEAERAYRKAISLGSAAPAVRIGLGSTLIEQGKAAEAIAVFRSVTASDPGFAAGWLALGKALYQTAKSDRDYAAAASAFDSAIQKGTTTAPAYSYLARIALRQRRDQDARRDLAQAQRLDPFDPQIPYLQAQVDRDLGQAAKADLAMDRQRSLLAYRDAKFALMEQVRAQPDRADLLMRLARLAYRNRDYTSAISYFGRLLQASPGDAGLKAELSRAEQAEGETASPR